jgi:Phosphoadenosine phosphosulfate reductase family
VSPAGAARVLSPELRQLEAESIGIIREVAAEFRNPVLLYSIGKDPGVTLHLALKAFYPSNLPFPLLHVDTGRHRLPGEPGRPARRAHAAPSLASASAIGGSGPSPPPAHENDRDASSAGSGGAPPSTISRA